MINQKNRPTFNAYFHKNSFKNEEPGYKISNLGDKSYFIPFTNNKERIDNLDDSDIVLTSDSYGYSQGFPIRLETDYCSNLHYQCVKYRRLLYLEKDKGNSSSKNLIKTYQSEVKYCENSIQLYCNNLNGNDELIQQNIHNSNNTVIRKILKIKENYATNGGYNQVCVISGFEDYPLFVYGQASTSTYVGKCLLTNKSKKNPSCRRQEFYEFCNKKSNDCIPINANEDSECSDGISCIKTTNCNCDGDDCLKLPESCFLPGVNINKTLFTKNNELDNVCECELTTKEIGTTKIENSTKFIVRNATNREIGLCVPLRDIKFCEPIRYYDKKNNYHDGGQGNAYSTIKSTYYSNVWRTKQLLYGKYFLGNLGHAEFDRSNDCSTLKNGVNDEYCLQRKKCFTNDGRVCNESGKDCSKESCTVEERECKCEYVQIGECKGFWKQRYDNAEPIAKCVTKKVGNIEYTTFEMIPETGCVRYSCERIDSSNAVRNSEMSDYELSELSIGDVNIEGKFNGFALWDEYKKGSDMSRTNNESFKECYEGYVENSSGEYELDSNGNLKCKNNKIYEENGYGDDIEERQARNCQQGFAPAGFGYIIKKYLPYISNSTSYYDRITKEDSIIKEMLGYNLDMSYFDNNNNIKKAFLSDSLLYQFQDYITKTGYNAKKHLPRRYCNQVGEWLEVKDIYTKYGFELYYVNNPVLKDIDSNGLINKSNFPRGTKETEINNYGESIDYREKYCERLYCNSITENDIGLISVETSEPAYSLKYSTTINNEYFPNTFNNYPKDPKNFSDNRVNSKTVNYKTYWRHAGGALWKETPAVRNSNLSSKGVEGTCLESKGFYPYNTKFLSDTLDLSSVTKLNITTIEQETFNKQWSSVIPSNQLSNKTYEINIKKYDFRDLSSKKQEVNPYRQCSKWGIWQPVENKCVATCEAIDPFHTGYTDFNNDGLIQNFEVTKLFAVPRNKYYLNGNPYSFTDKDGNILTYTNRNTTNNIRYGDKYTGGAKWPRAKAGSVVIGECDASVGLKENRLIEVDNFPDEGIQFLRTGTDNDIQVKIPQYLENEDGTTIGTIEEGNSDGLTDIGRPYRVETINTNSRPYRVCQLDGTWGPVHNPCANFTTCPDVSVYNANVIDNGLNNGIVNTNLLQSSATNNNITTFDGGSIKFNQAQDSQGKTNVEIEMEKSCSSVDYFESGTYKKYCNITNGVWNDSKDTNTCKLKTCGDLKITMGDIILLDTSKTSTYKYYPKDSGYKGQITINGTKYANYEISYQCPTGYYCANCKKYNNQFAIKYSCELDENKNPVWVLDTNDKITNTETNHPHCVPYACTFENLSFESVYSTIGIGSYINDNPLVSKNKRYYTMNKIYTSKTNYNGTTIYSRKSDGTLQAQVLDETISNSTNQAYYSSITNRVSLGMEYDLTDYCSSGYFVLENSTYGTDRPYSRCDFASTNSYTADRCLTNKSFAGYEYDGKLETNSTSNKYIFMNNQCKTEYKIYGKCTGEGCSDNTSFSVSNGNLELADSSIIYKDIYGNDYFSFGSYYELKTCNSGYIKDGDKKSICQNNGTWKEEGNGFCGKNCYGVSSNHKYMVFTNEKKDTFYDYVGGHYTVSLNHNQSTTRSFCIEFNLTDDSMGYYGTARYSCKNGRVTLSIDSYSVTHNDSYCKDESGRSWNIQRGRPGSKDCAGHTNRRNLGNYVTDNSPGGNTSCNSGLL